MSRGRHQVKPAKTAPVDTVSSPSLSSISSKQPRADKERKPSLLSPNFLSRKQSESKPPSSSPGPSPLSTVPSRQPTPELSLSSDSATSSKDAFRNQDRLPVPGGSSENPPLVSMERTPSARSSSEIPYQEVLDKFETLNTQAMQSSASSSVYSRDSISIYSSASSIYSSGASIYSFDEGGPEDFDRISRKGSFDPTGRDPEFSAESRMSSGLQYPQHARTVAVRRQDGQDAASRERSTLAKKAALFQNSRLRPQLPSFNTSLPMWSMVCRAAQASQDCYDSRALTRRGVYTPADSSKEIKAMIVDDQLIDESRLVVVSVRGTQFQSLTDWTVNKASAPIKPTGFLDDEENGVHTGFLQVTKAMVAQVASQLQKHPASSEKPALLFTGHSAGGAVAAMLYSHMLSTSVNSELTALKDLFPTVHCITFGAPPLSVTPLPNRNQGSGVFLSFANEGDPVLRLTNAAYVKTLAKLMTASPPPSATPVVAPPPVKVVRGSRGATVYRQALPPPPTIPWEELPLWPTPPADLTNAGQVVLMRDQENGSTMASKVTADDLKDAIFADLVQHTMEMYMRRVKEMALAAMMGKLG